MRPRDLRICSLTRIEGAVFGALMSAILLVALGRTGPGRLAWARWSGVFLVVFLSYFFWRWSYYGYPLPNTFYAKVDAGGSQVFRGLRHLSAFGAAVGYWLAIPLLGLALLRSRTVAILASAVAAQPCVRGPSVATSADVPLFVPILGVLFLLVAWGSEALLTRITASRGMRVISATLLGLACLYSARAGFTGPQYDYVKQDEAEVDTWKEIGRWFRDNAKSIDSIGVVPAGAVPYYRSPDTDMWIERRHDAHTLIAMGSGQAGHEKYNTAYVLNERRRTSDRRLPSLSRARRSRRQVLQYYPVERELRLS
jgi:hypothetical protein